MKTQPSISGIVRINIDFLLPNFDPNIAEANPPKIAPTPNIPARKYENVTIYYAGISIGITASLYLIVCYILGGGTVCNMHY